MWRIMQRSLEEALNSPEGFEHQSNLNLVHFYREELLKIYNGGNAIKILGEGIHGNMTRHGILEIRYRCAGRETVISPMWLSHILRDDNLEDSL